MGVSGCDIHNGSAITAVDVILPQLLNPVQLLLFMFSCQDVTQVSLYCGRDGMCQQGRKNRVPGMCREGYRWPGRTVDRTSG